MLSRKAACGLRWAEAGLKTLPKGKDIRQGTRKELLDSRKYEPMISLISRAEAKVQNWLGDWYPAEVEGSDPKSIADIGEGEKCYLKLGAFSFDALRFALIDKEARVSNSPSDYKHSHIRSISFSGGILKDQQLHFSPELNTLIGIRGSGKSSVH